jgi:hypothetical protein
MRFDKVLTSIQQFLLAIAIWGGDFATSIWLDYGPSRATQLHPVCAIKCR